MTDAIDYNALDNTFGGQLAQAGFIAAIYAATDFIPQRGPRLAAWAGLVSLNAITIAAFNAFDEDPRNDLTEVINREPGEAAGPAKTWAIIGGSVLAAVGAVAVSARVHRAGAGWLRTRGVDKPYSLMGLAVGACYVAATRAK